MYYIYSSKVKKDYIKYHLYDFLNGSLQKLRRVPPFFVKTPLPFIIPYFWRFVN